ncbi:Maf family protein [Pseudidiomarina halophila]|uniref:7-methyl-GTP pyrophosphatase n=1 Tax=Pseudidiomarina halophila TaxID=1449799 RepID=A0A432Y0D2_9GAMM|nr:Maf family protein [Pseudidiomarina halophila]RUO54398.1 septum formation inhibitor Maf [Pseudidiomarina halophila]
MPAIVLASTSPYRRMLLEKVLPDFICAAPHVDETAGQGEAAEVLVERLAIAKARALADDFPNHLLIGSDQVAVVDGRILGKPGNAENAIDQLTAAKGKTVTFYTGLAVYHSGQDELLSCVEPFQVTFRKLSAAEIKGYVELEQPFNCAGSFKSEGLGISLFESLRGDDPNSLVGLPVIQLLKMLRHWQVNPLLPENNTKS